MPTGVYDWSKIHARREPARIERLKLIAFMYGECTQAQIADELGLSQARVSQLLTEARRRGILSTGGSHE